MSLNKVKVREKGHGYPFQTWTKFLATLFNLRTEKRTSRKSINNHLFLYQEGKKRKAKRRICGSTRKTFLFVRTFQDMKEYLKKIGSDPTRISVDCYDSFADYIHFPIGVAGSESLSISSSGSVGIE